MSRHFRLSIGVTAIVAGCVSQALGQIAPPPGQRLIATYAGVLPCADCQGIKTELRLYAKSEGDLSDARFTLEETYLGTRGGDRTIKFNGSWATRHGTTTDPEAIVYQINSGDPSGTRYFLQVNANEIKLLDRQQREIKSYMNYSLKRMDGRMVGGYSSAETSDAGVKGAAQFAVGEQSTKTGRSLELVRIVRAERQVVAGLNYRLCLEVTEAGARQQALAVVYRNPAQQLSLTSWQPGACE
jgi:uncharacterized lipoprotein NlpE involved in copper resistance